MTRRRATVAELRRLHRRDGSEYFIGQWHDLTVHIAEREGGAWHMTLVESKPGGLRNLASKHRAESARYADKRTQYLERGERRAASKIGGISRASARIADALEKTNAQID
jgi:hypothetical protein